jgi:hypothetical protein
MNEFDWEGCRASYNSLSSADRVSAYEQIFAQPDDVDEIRDRGRRLADDPANGRALPLQRLEDGPRRWEAAGTGLPGP